MHVDAEYAVPPGERTVGQLVAEAIRLYGRTFWRALALGTVVATFNQLAIGQETQAQAVLLALAAPPFALAYIGACALAAGERPSRRSFISALVVGTVVFVPVGLLVWVFILPALAWLAFAGLAVPVALLERAGIRESLRRARRLGGADYVHALGALATLVIVYFISRSALLLLLHGQAGAALRTAAFLADLVLSPLLFLGSALLYFDQKARLESGSTRRRRRDARLHHADESDRKRRPDAQVQPGPAARGEP
jgi:hypothetical protein